MNAALLGRVVVVAGEHPAFAELVAALADAGAFVAFVSAEQTVSSASASFRADPADPSVWERVAPHVEQRLGPVDVVLADSGCTTTVAPVFLPDLRRRGHGDVLTAPADAAMTELLTLVAGTR
ncbi:MAG TPA: hypothetical protein VFJ98_06790 [Mycobacteriales bacterium]|jgi:hypothetical protein|nr:hypothetical protein [Mycobacteriales bacterium]